MKKELFKDIIGYDNIKKVFERLIDVLNNQEKYEKIGSSVPNGILLYGNPGLGKTTFANELLDNVNRKTYIIRKIKSNGNFIDYMNDIFNKATENQPSIILLDDLDKFGEKDNDEEYAAVQSLIDGVKDKNVFIIATANSKYRLPNSLLRSGRFDIKIEVDYPGEKESEDLIRHYLKNKKIAKDVNIKNLSYILACMSCADLEKVCNQAGIYAAFKNKDKIGNDELLRAALEQAYDTNIENDDEDDKYALNTAYHEAGHALVGEYLEPGSVTFITIARTDSDTKGITKYHKNDNYFDDITFMENRLISLLAGKAATDIIYNKCDTGANSDLDRAYKLASRFVDNFCMLDFNSYIRSLNQQSEKVKQSKDDNINKLMDKYYLKAKEIILKNLDKLRVLAYALRDKKILFHEEIEELLDFNNIR